MKCALAYISVYQVCASYYGPWCDFTTIADNNNNLGSYTQRDSLLQPMCESVCDPHIKLNGCERDKYILIQLVRYLLATTNSLSFLVQSWSTAQFVSSAVILCVRTCLRVHMCVCVVMSERSSQETKHRMRTPEWDSCSNGVGFCCLQMLQNADKPPSCHATHFSTNR